MIPEFWTTRDEAFLASILGESVELPAPQTRLELFLAKIAGMDVETPEPQTRAEIYLAAILGANVALPVPVSRVDLYLAKVAGLDVETPVPLTRLDEYLAEWAENGSGEIVTVTGTSPLVLANAMAHAIRKLVQFGKCSTSGGEIYCNNGKLTAVDDELPAGYKRLLGITFDGSFRYETGEHLTGADDVTMTLDNLSSSGKNVFGSYNGANDKNFSLYIYGSSTSGSYFRYGDQLKRPKYGGTGKRTITFGASGTSGFAEDSTVDPDTFTTPDNVYIGMLPNSSSPGYTGDILGNILVGTRLKWIPVERESDGAIGYYERIKGNFIAPTGSGTPVSLGYDTSHLNVLSVVGTPEVLTIGNQTASVENLFEVNGVADEQDIISGVITRKVEVSVANGVITLSPLATPVTEHVAPQPLSTVEGTNTVSWTAEVSGTVKEVEYAYVAPSFEWKSASGAVVSVSDAIAGEVGALTVSINPVQTGSGDPSPDNVRPISGWTQIDVWVQPTYDTSANPSATIPLGGTYYGGTLDVLTGVLTVTHTYETIDGDEPWALSGSNFRFALQPSNGFPTKAYGQKNVICDRYAATGTNSNRYVGITNSGLSTVDEFKAALAADHAHLCYELSNPQTVQLTPAQVSTLLGTNVIWASGNGEVSVTYRAEVSE